MLWDVVEEHLDEAAFLATQWEQALVSPTHTLSEVADRVEARLLAHVDALVVGGERVVERLLEPALQDGSEGMAFAAALALLSDASAESEAMVLAALGTAESGPTEQLQRALELMPSQHRQSAILPLLSSPLPRVRVAAARVLGFQQVDLGAALWNLLNDPDPETLAAGLYCLRYRPQRDAEFLLRQTLGSPHAAVVDAALGAGAVAGQPEVLEHCRTVLHGRHPATGTASLLLALLGSATDVKSLVAAVSQPESAAKIIFALGLGGTRDAADSCLDWLQVPALVAAASECFVTITGVDAEKEQLVLPPREEENDDVVEETNELAPQQSAAPVLLDGVAVAAWWQKNRSAFAVADRYFLGQPIQRQDPKAWLAAIERANMRQRHPLALALAACTRGQVVLQTHGLARDQRDQFSQLR